METEVSAVSIKKEECVIFHEIVYSEEENVLPLSHNKEDLILKQNPETIFVPIKKEENGDKLVCGNINYYPEEAVYQKLTGNITVYEKDPLDISNDEVNCIKQEVAYLDVKEEPMQSITEEKKYLTHENTKCSSEIVELEDECSANTDDPSYRSLNGGHIQPGTDYNSYRVLASGERKTENLIHQDKQLGKQIESVYHVISNTQNASLNHVCFCCYKNFSTSSNLKKHVDEVHNRINKYECNQCCKIFFRPDDIRRHVDGVHKGIKNFECDHCHKLFFRGDNLRRHVDSVHKKIKYYKCDVCCKMFSEAGDLKKHTNGVHKGIKNYQCNQCNRTFFRTNELKRHLDGVHKGIKRYECYECHKMFLCKAYLKSHVTRVHK